MKVKSESEVAQSCPNLATPWTAAYQAPPSMGFSRQEYWSGVSLPEANYLSHSQLQVLFLLTVYSFYIFNDKEYNQFDVTIDHLVMSMCKVISCVVERKGVCYDQCILLVEFS